MRAVAGEGDTTSTAYSERLVSLSGARWKRLVDVQRPYRWNLRRLIGQRRTLDVGCGIGRNLANLPAGSVGVDHNATSVEMCRRNGFEAETSADFLARTPEDTAPFDAMLVAHVVEHLDEGTAADVIRPYLAYVRPGSPVVLICPQERGFASDSTHTVFTDHDALRALVGELGLTFRREFSFPLPRFTGKAFTYNEFVTVASTVGRP
ncbi:MAG: methyltransferase type 11 [Pseudonocardia sp. SCN 72-86]|nr:MAG: methyltransferase type 11 [Pseudonocardia sp. SCN 72-86]